MKRFIALVAIWGVLIAHPAVAATVAELHRHHPPSSSPLQLAMNPGYRLPDNALAIIPGDFDGDGLGDVVTSYYGGKTPLTFLSGTRGDSLTPGPEPAIDCFGIPGVADLDGDGHPDLVVPQPFLGTVQAMLNDGHGRFRTTGTFPAGTTPFHVICVDFDGDGRPDVAVGDGTLSGLTVLRGLGGGRLGSPITCATVGIPGDMKVTDMNRDGLPDLVMMSPYCNTISIVLGSRASLVRSIPGVDAGAGIESFDVGDVDVDGWPDLVIGTVWPDLRIRILRGTPDGRFAVAPSIATDAYEVYSVGLIDLDGDGRLDICYGEDDLPFGSPLGILWNRAEGFVPDERDLLFEDALVSIQAVPLGAHHDPQFVAMTQDERQGRRSGVALLPRAADGTFLRQRGYSVSAPATPWVARRGRSLPPSLVMGQNSIQVLDGRGDGTFEPARNLGRGHVMGTIDFDGDGVDEWLVTRGDTLHAFEPGKDGAITERWAIPGFGALPLVAWFGRHDEIELVTNEPSPRFYPIDRSGRPGAPVQHPELGRVWRTLAGNDGPNGGPGDLFDFHLAPHCYHFCANDDDTLFVWHMDAHGRFQLESTSLIPPTLFSASWIRAMSARDLDGDGRSEVVVDEEGEDWHGTIVVLHQESNGSYSPSWTSEVDIGVGSIAFADFDGDGRVDLATASSNYYDDYEYFAGGLHVFLQDIDGGFHEDDFGLLQIRSHWIVAGDWNGDGRPDIAYTSGFNYGYPSPYDRVVTVMNTTPFAKRGKPLADRASAGVATPAPVHFGLDRVTPNPAPREFALEYSLLPNKPANVDLIDVAGRRVWSHEIAAGLGGRSSLTIGSSVRLPIGLYFVRLRQGKQTASSRVTIMR